MGELNVGQTVRVVSETDAGKIIGYNGDMIIVRFDSGYTDEYYPHELFIEE